MQKKLTITVDERVYEGLHAVIGRRKISRFIESLVRPHVVDAGLAAAYRQMAGDEDDPVGQVVAEIELLRVLRTRHDGGHNSAD